MKRSNMYRVLLLLILIVVPILVACGGGDDSDDSEATEQVLPTRAVLDDTTAEVTPEIGDDAPADPTPVAPPPNTDATPEVSTPATQGDAESTPDVNVDNVPPQASTPDSNDAPPESTAEVREPGPNVATDFSGLSANLSGIFVGTLSIETEEGNPEVVVRLTDAQGVSVQVIIPPVFSDELNGQVVQVQGVVIPSEANADALVIRGSNIAPEGEELIQAGPPTNGQSGGTVVVPEGVPTSENTPDTPPIPLTGGAELLDFQLDENLTALETYDALWAEVGDSLTDAIWLSLSGNNEQGWTIEFYVQADGATSSYTVTPDGMVALADGLNALPPSTEVNAIDRALVVVDSDDLPDPEANTDGPPIAPLMILRATAEGSIQWNVQGANATVIDATVAQ